MVKELDGIDKIFIDLYPGGLYFSHARRSPRPMKRDLLCLEPIHFLRAAYDPGHTARIVEELDGADKPC